MKTDYGVRAILDLAQRYGHGPVSSGEIAARQRIPAAFLDQVLLALRRAGLIQSVRGPHGGHLLAHAPGEVTLAAAVGALEGPAPAVDCAREGHRNTLACILHRVSARADEAVRGVLEAQSLEQLLREHGATPPVYHGIFKAAPPRPQRARRPRGRKGVPPPTLVS